MIPPMSREEREALKQSIIERGQFLQIFIDEEGHILDGHHRYAISQQLKSECKSEVLHFDSEEEKLEFIGEINVSGRNLGQFLKAEVGYKLFEPIEKKRAKERQLATLKKGDKFPIGTDSAEREGKVAEIVAKRIGIGYNTYLQCKTIMLYASQITKHHVRKGDLSVEYAYKQVRAELEAKKRKKHHDQNLKNGNNSKSNNNTILEGETFDVILADPPWYYRFGPMGNPGQHYPMMSDEEIKNLELPSDKNAVLFLWATSAKLDVAIDVLRAWGFIYKTSAVWVKQRTGIGYYFLGQHEFLLVATKGDGVGVPAQSNRRSSVFEADRGKHSEKPELVYEMIERMYPGRNYLELFARGKPRQGWKTWGYEADKNV